MTPIPPPAGVTIAKLAGKRVWQFTCPCCGQPRVARPDHAKSVLLGAPVLCHCPPVERDTEFGRERKCRQCGDWWLIELFHPGPTCHGGRRPICGACALEQKNKLRAIRRARKKSRRPSLSHDPWSDPWSGPVGDSPFEWNAMFCADPDDDNDSTGGD